VRFFAQIKGNQGVSVVDRPINNSDPLISLDFSKQTHGRRRLRKPARNNG
jgi:hypothetical protein